MSATTQQVRSPRVVFIAGMEHSGTTLLDYHISHMCGGIGLGEAHMLLDNEKREQFFNRWGDHDDADMCSCGLRHSECPIWGPCVADIAESPSLDAKSRYRKLLSSFDGDDLLIDSSKSKPALELLIQLWREGSISSLSVVVAVKDPREFVTSLRKVRQLGLKDQYAAFNWWSHHYNTLIDQLDQFGVSYLLVQYRDLCLNSEATLARIFSHVGQTSTNGASTSGHSHICMGNKKFVNSPDKSISYDDRWRAEWLLRLFYTVHLRARHTNSRMKALSTEK